MEPQPRWTVSTRSRIIVDNDWSGDPDGLAALAHHLLSPSNQVLAVTSSFLDPAHLSPQSSARDGAALAHELVALIGEPTMRPDVYAGADTTFGDQLVASPAADAIVALVLANEPPVTVVCGGPLTNVADALWRAPEIASRMRLLWVGGSTTAGADEYNRDTDVRAAAFVLGQPTLDVIQFPVETYRRCVFSVAELAHDLGSSGEVGAWLWRRYCEVPLPDVVRIHGVWPLGDSPPVVVTALSDDACTFLPPTSSGPGARVTVCTDVDMRLLVGDMLAKLRLHETRRRQRKEPPT